MTKRPQGYREPTEEEMKCLPEGSLWFDDQSRTWGRSELTGELDQSAFGRNNVEKYAVPIVAQAKRPQGYREPTDEEMKGPLPEGTKAFYNESYGWLLITGPMRNPQPGFQYAVPITVGETADELKQLRGTDPKQQHGEKKPQLHLIPKAALEECAKALELGARKYGERNWVLGNGVQLTTYLSAMARHLALVADGSEDVDPESGAHHLGHIMAGCAIVLDAMKHGKLIDNRVVPTQNG